MVGSSVPFQDGVGNSAFADPHDTHLILDPEGTIFVGIDDELIIIGF